jgi:hypothetical protein
VTPSNAYSLRAVMRSSPLLPGVCSIATPTVEGVTAVRLYSKLAWSRRAAPCDACKPPCKVGLKW